MGGRCAGIRRPVFGRKLEALLGPRRMPSDPLEDRHRDIARSVQAMYEEAFFHLIGKLQRGLRSDRSRACRRLRHELGRQRQGASDDAVPARLCAGGCGRCGGRDRCGVCALAQARRHAILRHGPCLLGAAFRAEAISPSSDVLSEARDRGGGLRGRADVEDEAELCRRTAAAIADGKVVGWFQGRMEWGPRALGNRSILCDPRRADMKAILNAKIKRRESFRPFAPSVLEEAVAEWFEEDDDVPFMMQVFQIREEKRPLIPAVTHVDGSGRLQTVSSTDQSTLSPADRELSRPDRRADGAQHVVQRERAGGLRAEGGARLLPAHENGRAGDGQNGDRSAEQSRGSLTATVLVEIDQPELRPKSCELSCGHHSFPI